MTSCGLAGCDTNRRDGSVPENTRAAAKSPAKTEFADDLHTSYVISKLFHQRALVDQRETYLDTALGVLEGAPGAFSSFPG